MKKMKTMWITIVKAMAKWVLGYLPDVAVWAIRQGAGAAKGNVKAATVLCVVKRIATDAALVARIMEDGEVTSAEEAEVTTTAMDLVEQIKTAM